MRHWSKRLFRIFLETLPLYGLIFLLNPILIAFSTAEPFDYNFSFVILSIVCIGVCTLTAFFISFFSNKYRQIAIALLRSLFVVFFVVSIFYPASGRQIDGGTTVNFSWIYYIIIYFFYIFSVIFLVWFFLRRKVVIRNIYLTFVLLGSASVVYYPLHHWVTSEKQTYYSDKDDVSFASDKNIVVILADMLQGSTLEQYLTMYPNEKNNFQGFTLFSRATSPFPFTFYGAPALFTGNLYGSDSDTSSAHAWEAARASSFVTDAEDSGFDSTIIGLETVKLHNAQLFYQSSNSVGTAITLFALSAQRITKISIRTGFLDPTMWLVGYKKNSKDIMDRLTAAPVGKSQNKILFFHSMVPHAPMVFGRKDLESSPLFLKPLKMNVDNYWDEMGFFVGQVARLLEHMKQIGIYDKSLIIITGDHGHVIGREDDDVYKYAGAEDFEGFVRGPWMDQPSMYNAAILIKPPLKQDPLQISRVASSTLGLRPLIRRYLADQASDVLRDFQISKNKVVVFKPNVSSNIYSVADDHIVLEFTGNVCSLVQQFAKDRWKDQDLSYNIGIKATNVSKYLDDSWIKEPKGAWLKGKPAKLFLNTSGVANKAYKIQMVCLGLLNKQHLKQRVKVWLNNKYLDTISLEKTGKNTVELEIPANLLVNGVNEFKFDPLDAISPKEIDAWDFPKPISVYLYSFQICESGAKS